MRAPAGYGAVRECAMDTYTEKELKDALQTVTAVISACEKAQPKFAPGTAQHSLLKNRLKALHISAALMKGTPAAVGYSPEELTEALKPMTSIIGKCEKARLKSAEGTAQHTRFSRLITAMKISRALIRDKL